VRPSRPQQRRHGPESWKMPKRQASHTLLRPRTGALRDERERGTHDIAADANATLPGTVLLTAWPSRQMSVSIGCSAEFQSAVSPNGIRHTVGSVPWVRLPNASQSSTLRYSAARRGRNQRSADSHVRESPRRKQRADKAVKAVRAPQNLSGLRRFRGYR